MSQPTVPAHLVGEINGIRYQCSVTTGIAAQCGQDATHTLTVHCPTHGSRPGLLLCPDHARRVTEAATRGYVYRCGGACPVHVETAVL